MMSKKSLTSKYLSCQKVKSCVSKRKKNPPSGAKTEPYPTKYTNLAEICEQNLLMTPAGLYSQRLCDHHKVRMAELIYALDMTPYMPSKMPTKEFFEDNFLRHVTSIYGTPAALGHTYGACDDPLYRVLFHFTTSFYNEENGDRYVFLAFDQPGADGSRLINIVVCVPERGPAIGFKLGLLYRVLTFIGQTERSELSLDSLRKSFWWRTDFKDTPFMSPNRIIQDIITLRRSFNVDNARFNSQENLKTTSIFSNLNSNKTNAKLTYVIEFVIKLLPLTTDFGNEISKYVHLLKKIS